MRRETLRARKLSHPNIIRIHDFIQPENEPPFIAMEYVDGPNLHFVREARHTKVLPWAFLVPIVRQLCGALDYAHSEKVVHRDLKPANLMLDSSGRLRLADFGLARVAHDSVTRLSGMTMPGGTVNFMSPQQADGQPAQPADDIYSLGATLYDLLTSRPPFYEGDVGYQVRHNRPAPMSQRLLELGLANEIPSEVSALVMACLAKEPEQRPPNAKAILDFLDAAEKQQPAALVPNAPGPAAPPVPPPVTPLPAAPVVIRPPEPQEQDDSLARTIGLALAGAVLFVVLGVGIGGGWWWFQHQNQRGLTPVPSAGPKPPVPPTPVVEVPPTTQSNAPVLFVPPPTVALPVTAQSIWEECPTLHDGRIYHSAVWTGKELLIWGGGSRSHYLNDGAAYNPETKTWRTVSTRNAPSGRWAQATVWTGHETIVWGGRSSFAMTAFKRDGGRYNPETDTWTPIPPTDALPASSQMAAVWTGQEMIVWGGVVDGGHISSSGARYNPSTGSWTPLPSAGALEGRCDPLSLWTGREMIVWGGLDYARMRTVGTGGRYDPLSNTWKPITINGAPLPIWAMAGVWTGEEMLVWGGERVTPGTRANVAQGTGARYHPATDQWRPITMEAAPTARSYPSAVWTGTEMIVWGGAASPAQQKFNTGARYNPELDRWTPTEMNDAPPPASMHSATWTGNGMLVLNGSGGFTPYNTLYYYHPSNGAKPTAATSGERVYRVCDAFYKPTNPSGPWSFGWEPEIGGPFTPLKIFFKQPSDNGVSILSWQFGRMENPAVFCNTNDAAATAARGVGVFPKNSVWFYPGQNGRPENFGAIRFTTPVAGLYRLNCVTRGDYGDQPPGGDTDLHIVMNGREIWGKFLPRAGLSDYSITLTLRVSDTVDFLVGRGADRLLAGLVIDATLTKLP